MTDQGMRFTQSGRRRKPSRAKQLGVTDADYSRMLEAQDGGCALCGAKPRTRRLHVDHDHKTMRIRGLLCHRCNRGLPTWATVGWLQRAAAYLHAAVADVPVVDSPQLPQRGGGTVAFVSLDPRAATRKNPGMVKS